MENESAKEREKRERKTPLLNSNHGPREPNGPFRYTDVADCSELFGSPLTHSLPVPALRPFLFFPFWLLL
ncbi:uncharacterized protein UV8b_04960 [Ustilaginoidea virens]|uniref:Uncharacterized protein n=1 Tax=Ustilaginoidea virens TaxID=1159556 RepID=A0A8E5HSA5_USTVR|nr:uncharacterized protein UV8b_04960 [Ustilaginoidea virens]QUC20719.1 hypothetical protein UV8b_04960 [Ustilaginoidea virens]